MGASLLQPEQICVYDVMPARMEYLGNTYRVRLCSSIAAMATECDIIVLAVKPQVMTPVLGELSPSVSHRPLVISIAAGIPLPSLVKGLPERTPVIRVMPNTPALVLQGASALTRGPDVTDAHMQRALALFEAVGKALEVEEKWMDTVTGLSGSGPAYVLLFLESLIDAGVLMGLPRPVARQLAVQTVLGTAKMVDETGKHPAELKDLITSPGGTTIRGLEVMEERGLRGTVMRAVEAATLRSQELGKG